MYHLAWLSQAPRKTIRVTSSEHLELKLLWRFLAAVEYGSFAKAARSINLTQQAVAYSIASLENSLGVPLFDRDQSGIVVTDYGKRLAHHARALLAESKRTIDSLRALQSASAGAVSIGVSEVLSAHVVPLALARLLGKYPNIEVTVREGTSQRMYELLLHGDIDIMVGAPPIAIKLGDNIEQQFSV